MSVFGKMLYDISCGKHPPFRDISLTKPTITDVIKYSKESSKSLTGEEACEIIMCYVKYNCHLHSLVGTENKFEWNFSQIPHFKMIENKFGEMGLEFEKTKEIRYNLNNNYEQFFQYPTNFFNPSNCFTCIDAKKKEFCHCSWKTKGYKLKWKHWEAYKEINQSIPLPNEMTELIFLFNS